MAQVPVSYQFDGSGIGVSPGLSNKHTVQGTYDFATYGGGTGLYTIARLNKGAEIVGGYMEVIGTPAAVSGTPAIGINSVGTGDVLASASVLGAPWSTTGRKAIVPNTVTGTISIPAMTADTNIQVAITTAAISAGKFVVYLDVIG